MKRDKLKRKLIPAEDVEPSSETPSSETPFWEKYQQVYEKIAETSLEVTNVEEFIATTRIIDLTTAKLAEEISKLDLSSVDHWLDISKYLIQNWHNFFSVSENDGWSFSDLIPLARYRAMSFGSHSILKRKLTDERREEQTNKRKRHKRDDNTRTKVSKPTECMADDKPLPLIHHMEKVMGAIESNCNGSRSIDYFRLILNPDSYSLTVYNIFTISFLIREDLVHMSVGKDGNPLISLNSKSQVVDSQETEQRKYHFTIELTTAEWKALVKKLKITTPLIVCPEFDAGGEHFYERFTQSQKERVHMRKK